MNAASDGFFPLAKSCTGNQGEQRHPAGTGQEHSMKSKVLYFTGPGRAGISMGDRKKAETLS